LGNVFWFLFSVLLFNYKTVTFFFNPFIVDYTSVTLWRAMSHDIASNIVPRVASFFFKKSNKIKEKEKKQNTFPW